MWESQRETHFPCYSVDFVVTFSIFSADQQTTRSVLPLAASLGLGEVRQAALAVGAAM
jgi:hypothetical protein